MGVDKILGGLEAFTGVQNYNSKRAKAFRTAPLFWGTDHLEVVWDHFHSSVIILLRAFLGTNHLDLVWDHFHSSKSIFGDRPL